MFSTPLIRLVGKSPLVKTSRTIYFPRKHGLLKMSNPDVPWFRFMKETVLEREETKESLKEEFHRICERFKNILTHKHVPVLDKNYYFDHFDSDERIKKWKPVADSDTFSGYSTSKFSRSVEGHALFSGFLDNRVPDDGICMSAGFAGVISPAAPRTKTFRAVQLYDWEGFNMVEIRFRGDGRKYHIVLNTADPLDDQSCYDGYCYPIYTRGGPYWQTLRIPRENFLFMFRGRLQDDQYRMPDEIKYVALVLSDSYDGPFALEVDYIALKDSKETLELYSTFEGYCYPHLKYIQTDIECLPPE